MEQNKLDRFFREKTEAFEVMPSSNAWEQIAQQTKKPPINWVRLYRVAAIMIITIGIGWLMNNTKEDNQQEFAEVKIDMPQPQVLAQIAIPEVTTKKPKENKVVPQEKINVPKDYQESYVFESEFDLQMSPVALLSPKPFSLLETSSLNIITIEIKLFQDVKPKISIEYFANATSDQGEASIGKLGKIIAYAKSSSPAEIIADIRDAKDQFFDSRLNMD